MTRSTFGVWGAALALAGIVGCGGTPATDDAAVLGDTGNPGDASHVDAGRDAGSAVDAFMADGGIDAASVNDAAMDDAATVDAAMDDAATLPDAFVNPDASPLCGNGVLDGTEGCDLGTRNSDALVSGCTTACQLTSLVAWFDASDPNADGTTPAAGAATGTWRDLARHNDATQADAAKQPTYATSAINGQPAFTFDGTDDTFAVPVDLTYTTNPEMTIIAVFENTPGSVESFSGVWGQDDGGWDRFMSSGGTASEQGISNGGGFTGVPGLLDPNVPVVATATMRGPGSTVYVNGALAVTYDESHNNPGVTSFSIGNVNGPGMDMPNWAFDGAIAQILVFNRALTDAERATAEAGVLSRYLSCGDGTRSGTEQCDRGTAGNDGSYGGCNADCTLAPFCGDGAANDPSETCDRGALNGTNFYDACSTTCQTGPILAWLTATDVNGDGTIPADGDPVGTWAELEYGLDATQTTASARPTYRAAAINGHPALQFDGNDDVLALPVDIDATAHADMTIIAVVQNAAGDPSTFAGIWGQDDGGWDRFFTTGGTAGSQGISYGGGFVAVPGSLVNDAMLLLTAEMSDGGAPNSSTVYVNGALAVSYTESHNNTGVSTTNIGNVNGPTLEMQGWAFDGYIAELVFFDRLLTDAERVQIEALLTTRYAP